MAANDRKEQVAWDLDWDDLTDSALIPPRRLPQATSPSPSSVPTPAQPSPAPTASPTPPPLPRRAFPTPSLAFADPEPEAIVEPRRLPTTASVPASPPALPANPTPGVPARTLVRGQRLKLAEIFPGAVPPPFEAVLTLAPTTAQTPDLSCFGLDENGKLADDRYFIFYNQTGSPEGALTLVGTGGNVFGVNLSQLPNTVRRLVFAATIDGAGSVRGLGTSRFELRARGASASALRYEFSGGELDEVKALMIAEVYYKDGWRLAAVGQGFAGGLGELLRHFGGREI